MVETVGRQIEIINLYPTFNFAFETTTGRWNSNFRSFLVRNVASYEILTRVRIFLRSRERKRIQWRWLKSWVRVARSAIISRETRGLFSTGHLAFFFFFIDDYRRIVRACFISSVARAHRTRACNVGGCSIILIGRTARITPRRAAPRRSFMGARRSGFNVLEDGGRPRPSKLNDLSEKSFT